MHVFSPEGRAAGDKGRGNEPARRRSERAGVAVTLAIIPNRVNLCFLNRIDLTVPKLATPAMLFPTEPPDISMAAPMAE